jgi:hypothetical protein
VGFAFLRSVFDRKMVAKSSLLFDAVWLQTPVATSLFPTYTVWMFNALIAHLQLCCSGQYIKNDQLLCFAGF